MTGPRTIETGPSAGVGPPGSPRPATTPTLSRREAIGLAAVAALLHLAVGLLITRPLILPDEAGYLLNARRIATLGDPSQLVYFPGYSALIAPFFAISDDLTFVFRSTQVINAILSGLAALALFRSLQRLYPGLSRVEAVGAITVVSLYPAYVFFSSLAISENLFVPVVTLSFLLLLRFADEPTVMRAVALGAVGGASILIHQRAVALTVAAVVGLVAVAGARSRQVLAGSAAAIVAAALSVVVARLILDSATDPYQFGVSSRTTVTGLVTDNLGPRALVTLPFTILGQLFYVSVATFGLVPLAVLWCAQRLRHSERSTGAAAWWLTALGGTTVLIAGLFMNQGTGDKAIYGRYLEAILVPFLGIGTVELLRRANASSQKILVAIPAAAAVVLLAVRGTDAFAGRQQLLNISVIEPIVRFNGIDVYWIAVCGVIGIGLLFETVRRHGAMGLAVVGLVWAVSTGFVFDRATAALDNLSSELQLGHSLSTELLPRVVPERRCVAIDDSVMVSPWHQQNYRLQQLDVRFRRWDSTTDDEPCGAFALSSRGDLEQDWPGAVVVAAEPDRNFLVWFVGDETDLVDGPLVGSASPTGFLEQATLISLSDAKVLGADDELVTVEVTLTNTTDHVLIPAQALPDGLGGVAVGVEWKLPTSGERLHEPRRAGLPGVVRPGEQVVLEGELPYEIDDFEVDDGQWMIHFEVVQEGWRWTGPTTAVQIPYTVSRDG